MSRSSTMCLARPSWLENLGSFGSSGWLSMTQSRSKRCLAVGGSGEHDVVAVPRAEGAARPSRVLDATALAHHPLAPVVRGRVLEDAESRLVERGIDPLPFPRGVAMTERSHHAEGGEETRHVVRIHGRGARRRPIGGPPPPPPRPPPPHP